jgi:hypothetical protein
MFRSLGRIFKSRKNIAIDAEIAELRAAVAGLLAASSTNVGSLEERNAVDAVLLHASSARIEMERVSALYEGAMARIAELESRLDTIES